jgi:hypothetical protein
MPTVEVKKHPDALMTPGQIARRKFKSFLPRTPQERNVSAMQALAELFKWLDQFRGILRAEQQRKTPDDPSDPAKTLYAAVAYRLPGAAELASTLPVPEPGAMVGAFCDAVMALENPTFLGVVFVQAEPGVDAVSFAAPFMSGPEASARLRYAQDTELLKIRKVLEGRHV